MPCLVILGEEEGGEKGGEECCRRGLVGGFGDGYEARVGICLAQGEFTEPGLCENGIEEWDKRVGSGFGDGGRGSRGSEN